MKNLCVVSENSQLALSPFSGAYTSIDILSLRGGTPVEPLKHFKNMFVQVVFKFRIRKLTI